MTYSKWWWETVLKELDKAGYMIVKKPITIDKRGQPSKPGPNK